MNVHEAKTHLSRLLDRVSAGDEIIIAKAGKPVARLVPLNAPGERRLGLDAGLVTVPDGFNDALPDDVLADFER